MAAISAGRASFSDCVNYVKTLFSEWPTGEPAEDLQKLTFLDLSDDLR